MKKKNNLKLYVWENVLMDYTSGVMFALARSPDHARKLCLKEYGPFVSDRVRNDLKAEPLVVTRPKGFTVSGGG